MAVVRVYGVLAMEVIGCGVGKRMRLGRVCPPDGVAIAVVEDLGKRQGSNCFTCF